MLSYQPIVMPKEHPAFARRLFTYFQSGGAGGERQGVANDRPWRFKINAKGLSTSIQSIMMKPTLPVFRPPRPSRPACERHAFSLRPHNDRLHRPHHLSLSFCDPAPAPSVKPGPPSRTHSCLNCPVVNQDRSHASPAFILRSQRGHYQQQRETLRLQHELKVRYSSEEKTELNIPKPKSRNNYCSVCHANYDDYLQHTGSNPHREKLRKSPFNNHILELANKISLQVISDASTTPIKPSEATQEGESDAVEIVQTSRKRIKEDSPTVGSQCNQIVTGNGQTNSVMGWVTQAQLPSAVELSTLLSHQMALSHYLSMVSTPFPLISPLYPALLHLPYPLPYPLPFAAALPAFTPAPAPLPLKNPACIVIDD